MAFLAIVLILVFGLAAGGLQLNTLQQTQKRAIEQSVPTLIHAHVLESQLARLFNLSSRLRQTDSSDLVGTLHSEIQSLVDSIQETVDVKFEQGLQTPELDSLLLEIPIITKTIDDLVPIRLKLIEIDHLLDDSRQNLATLRSVFNELIEPRAIDIATELSIASESEADIHGFGDLLVTQSELTELSFRISTIIDIADQLTRSNAESFGGIDVSQINSNLKSVAQILLVLDDDSSRRELALVVRKLQRLVFGVEGVTKQLENRIELQEHFDESQQMQIATGQSISELVVNIVTKTRLHIAQSSAIFTSTLHKTILLLVVIGVVVVIIIAITGFFVIERQFNQRMTQLTEAVVDIAAGDVDRKVGLQGNDEIGLMANALSVFKGNAKKLLYSNRELEQFAYAASHDLRSPLRAMENLAQWILEDAGDTLSSDCHDNLLKLIDRAERLSALQTDLLNYSRAGREQEEEKYVDIESMVQDISEILDPECRFPVEVVNGDHVVLTQVTPLRQILMNLYSNAVKHHDVGMGQLKIEVEYSSLSMKIFFIDDGPGVEPKYQAQIFELFKRLQSQDVVEGSGLGLTLVRKLVERQGGQIKIFSNPSESRGATFVFDWPITHSAQLGGKAVGF